MRHGRTARLLQRQSRLGPPLVHASMHCRSMVKCLNLRLFIDRQHHCMRGRSHIKPHDIPQFLHESGILRQFEDAPAMWCKTVGGPPSRACKHALPGNGSAVPLQHRAPRPWPLLARSSASPHAAAVSASGARSRPPCPPEPAPTALPGGRVLSDRSPSTPASAKRSCQRQTVVFDLPPLGHSWNALPGNGCCHDPMCPDAIGAQQYDPRTPGMLLRCF